MTAVVAGEFQPQLFSFRAIDEFHCFGFPANNPPKASFSSQ